jgi:hypothetical protein
MAKKFRTEKLKISTIKSAVTGNGCKDICGI